MHYYSRIKIRQHKLINDNFPMWGLKQPTGGINCETPRPGPHQYKLLTTPSTYTFNNNNSLPSISSGFINTISLGAQFI